MIRVPLVWLLLFFVFSAHAQQNAMAAGKKAGYIKVSRIVIEGNRVTKKSVILREIDLHEGDVISKDSITAEQEDIKLRLFNLQLFNEVDQHTETDSANNTTWYISVKERWYIIPTFTVQYADKNFNTWLVKDDHNLKFLTGGVVVTDKNFAGNLEQLSVTVQAGYSQGLGISYLRPYANKGQTRGIGFWLYAAQGSETYYNTDSNKLAYIGSYNGPLLWRQREGGLTYVYRPAYASKHIFRLGYKYYSVSGDVLAANTDYFNNHSTTARYLELAYRYEYNGVDNWNYSLVGQKLVATAVVRQGFEGIGFQSYVRTEAGIFRNPLPHWYWSAIFRGRLMYPQDQPYYFRSALGSQTEYVRGYEYYVIDGTDYGILRLDLKREIFNKTYILPIRYFTAIPLCIYPKLFADAGYVGNPAPGNSFLNNRLLYSFGAGVDILTLYDIKIRLEVAWNHLWQNGVYLHFNSE